MLYTTTKVKEYMRFASRVRDTIIKSYEGLNQVNKIIKDSEAGRKNNLPVILNQMKLRKSGVKKLSSESEKYDKEFIEYVNRNMENVFIEKSINVGTLKKIIPESCQHETAMKQLSDNLVRLKELEQELDKGKEKIESLMN